MKKEIKKTNEKLDLHYAKYESIFSYDLENRSIETQLRILDQVEKVISDIRKKLNEQK